MLKRWKEMSLITEELSKDGEKKIGCYFESTE